MIWFPIGVWGKAPATNAYGRYLDCPGTPKVLNLCHKPLG